MLPLLLLCLCSLHLVHCVTLDGELFVNDMHMLGRMAKFNKEGHAKVRGKLIASPAKNRLLCSSIAKNYFKSGIALIPRGNCSFQQKARMALASGAVGIIVYNTLESRYGWSEVSQQVKYPNERYDYECANGEALIPKNKLSLDPPRYSSERHDDLLTLGSPNNLCQFNDTSTCDSKLCLVAAKDEQYRACCAWDMHVTMNFGSSAKDRFDDGFVSMFCTMGQGSILQGLLQEQVTIQTRPYSKFNVSSILLWLLAIVVVTISSFYSIRDYRKGFRMLEDYMENVNLSVLQQGSATMPALPTIQEDDGTVAESEASSLDDEEGHDEEGHDEEGHDEENEEEHIVLEEEKPMSHELALSPPSRTINLNPEQLNEPLEDFVDEDESDVGDEEQQRIIIENEVPHREAPEITTSENVSSPTHPAAATSENVSSPTHPAATTATPRTRRRRRGRRTSDAIIQSQDAFELTVWHALAFVVMASSVVLLLFYFEFYGVVAVLYAVGCSGAMAQLVFYPVYNAFVFLRGPFMCVDRFHGFSWAIFFAGFSACGLAAAWLYVGFTVSYPTTNSVFFWVTQNFMASCACIVFLSVIRLSSIKVATALLIAVFLYDIFFVFISPYFFSGESVMVTVATSGGGASGNSSDENFCEKYPDDSACQSTTIMPLVLSVPRIDDYRGGSTILGLGDLVLPGLLIAFSARLDQAKRLALLVGLGESVSKPPTKWYHGYLFPLLVAYAFGLMMAYVAVRLMDRGQPALLYIVPCCLGTTVVVGFHELRKLWSGPPELEWANKLVTYCERNATRLTVSTVSLTETATSVEVGAASASLSPFHLATEESSRNSARSLT